MPTTQKASGNIAIVWGTANAIGSPAGMGGTFIGAYDYTAPAWTSPYGPGRITP